MSSTTDSAGAGTRRVVPFWIHQAVEYLLAAALFATAFHVGNDSRWALIAGGALLILLAAVSGPPLGAWNAVSRRGHRLADWVAIVLLAASPALPGRDGVSIITLEACAVALWRMAAVTRFDPPVTRRRPQLDDAHHVGPGPGAPADPALGAAVDAMARRPARAAGLAVGIMRRRRRELRDPEG